MKNQSIPFQWQLLNTLTHFLIVSLSALTVTIAKSRRIPVTVTDGKYISITGHIYNESYYYQKH